jgi:hypothetical protein
MKQIKQNKKPGLRKNSGLKMLENKKITSINKFNLARALFNKSFLFLGILLLTINIVFAGDITAKAGDLDVDGNLTVGQKIGFALGEIIDNIIDGWITITGNLNVTGNIETNGNITADYYFGDGSQLTNLPDGGNSSWNESRANDLYVEESGSSVIEGNITIRDGWLLMKTDDSPIYASYPVHIDVDLSNYSIGDTMAIFRNTDSDAGAGAEVLIQTYGGADPTTRYIVDAGGWATGLDNSDGDKYKIHDSASLADESKFELDKSGNLEVQGNITSEGANITGDLSVGGDFCTLTLNTACPSGYKETGNSTVCTCNCPGCGQCYGCTNQVTRLCCKNT